MNKNDPAFASMMADLHEKIKKAVLKSAFDVVVVGCTGPIPRKGDLLRFVSFAGTPDEMSIYGLCTRSPLEVFEDGAQALVRGEQTNFRLAQKDDVYEMAWVEVINEVR